jgi:hypothetical protein
MNEAYEREEELKDRQDGRTFRVGRVLRRTFDERGDEVLEPRITRLMLQLTHLPYGDERCSTPAAMEATPPAAGRTRPSWLERIAARLGGGQTSA